MKKKPKPAFRLPASNPGLRSTILHSPTVRERDLWLYARSFHNATKKLAGALPLESTTFTDLDVCPVVFMYGHALELHLKAIVLGHGGNFLATRPDPLSIHKTHSVSWLAQFVCQIVTALKWEEEFKCDGVENLAEFKAIIEELNAVDPGSYVFRFRPSQRSGCESGSCEADHR